MKNNNKGMMFREMVRTIAWGIAVILAWWLIIYGIFWIQGVGK